MGICTRAYGKTDMHACCDKSLSTIYHVGCEEGLGCRDFFGSVCPRGWLSFVTSVALVKGVLVHNRFLLAVVGQIVYGST